MAETFYDKTKSYMDELKAYEKNHEYDKALVVIQSGKTYIDGFLSNEQNETRLFYYENYKNVWSLYGMIIRLKKENREQKNNTASSINQLIEKVNGLEKRIEFFEKNK